MVSGVRHDASACPFEVAAGSVTGFRLDGEQGRGSSASWGFRGYDDLQGVLRWLVSSRDSKLWIVLTVELGGLLTLCEPVTPVCFCKWEGVCGALGLRNGSGDPSV